MSSFSTSRFSTPRYSPHPRRSAMPESETTPSPACSSFRRYWIAGVLTASLTAWGLLNFTPIQIELPPELRDVNMYSPPEHQARYAELLPWVKSMQKHPASPMNR